MLRGESTPFYLYDRARSARIRALIPAARLIVILRDPVERAHSNWTHLWSAGPRADRRLRARLRRGGAPDRGRLGGLLALPGARTVRRAARAPVHGVPARAGAGAALPGAGRRPGRGCSTGSARFLGVPTGCAHRDPEGERDRASRSVARPPRRLPGSAPATPRPGVPGTSATARPHRLERSCSGTARAPAARPGSSVRRCCRGSRRTSGCLRASRRGLQRLGGPHGSGGLVGARPAGNGQAKNGQRANGTRRPLPQLGASSCEPSGRVTRSSSGCGSPGVNEDR